MAKGPKPKDDSVFNSDGGDVSLLLETHDYDLDEIASRLMKLPIKGDDSVVTFSDLKVGKKVLKAIEALGFERPTAIQQQAIPVFMEGRDLIGQAQTGTGKTAAFALPILSNFIKGKTYALVLEPTRELALQVAEAFQSFAKFIDGFHVLPIYGGSSYENQIRAIRHGVSVIVATPGRLIDLIEHNKVDISEIEYLILDEADEMLHMGFLEDVQWILEHAGEFHQTALFSATMPDEIRAIAKNYLHDPAEVRIKAPTTTASTVRQRYWVVSGAHKIDAISRMLEVEDYDGVLVFVRTKTDAEDVANRLMARGFACVALHGDIPQKMREKTIQRLKKGDIDIIIATDVAARGLDVERISHVFNYDIPYDAESYVHRIGRTGRAGRSGEAILFVTPRERGVLRQIERIIGHRIEPMAMPSVADVNRSRLDNFKKEVLEIIDTQDLGKYQEVISEMLQNDAVEIELLAAALAKMSQRAGDLFLDESEADARFRSFDDEGQNKAPRGRAREISAKASPLDAHPDINMVRYRVAVGRRDGVRPSQLVGAIANEGNISSEYIGEINIYDTFCTVDLPEGIPDETRRILMRARVCGKPLELREYTDEPPKKGRKQEGSKGSSSKGSSKGPSLKGRSSRKGGSRPHIDLDLDGQKVRVVKSAVPGRETGKGRSRKGKLDAVIKSKKGRF